MKIELCDDSPRYNSGQPRPIDAWLLQESADPDSGVGLSSAIAHELRQLLTGIVLTGQALRIRLGQASPRVPEWEGLVDEMVETGQHAAEVVDRLQAMTRKEGLPGESVDVNKLVADALRLTKTEILRHGIIVSFEPAPRLPAVHADPVQIVQVGVNLIRNACEAMAAVPLRERRLRVMTRIDAQGWVSVTVADSGPGLDPEVRLKIFHPFKTAKPAGMGIGLTLCRLIAEAHGARIGVAESLPGSGAVFVLSLPPILNPAASSADEAIADRLCRR